MDEIYLNTPGIAKALLIDKKVLELSGKIYWGQMFGDWETVYLIQESGYKVNIASRIDEANYSHNGNPSVCYWITDQPKTPEELIEHNMLAADGLLNVRLKKDEIWYSEITTSTDYVTTLKFGGHDLLQELITKRNKYLYMMIEWRD